MGGKGGKGKGSKSKGSSKGKWVLVKRPIEKTVIAPWKGRSGGKDKGRSKGREEGSFRSGDKGRSKGKGKGKGKGKKHAAPLASEFWERKVEDEDRKELGEKTFTGTIQRYMGKFGYGFISPDDPAGLPKKVIAALKAAVEQAEDDGREVEDPDLLYFRKPDVNHSDDFRLTNGTPCTFKCYVDNKGAGARDVSQA